MKKLNLKHFKVAQLKRPHLVIGGNDDNGGGDITIVKVLQPKCVNQSKDIIMA